MAPAAVAALVWVGVATAASGHSGSAARPRLSIVLDRPVPPVVQVGERLTIAGHVRNGPRRGRLALESSSGRHWRVRASTALERDGAFALHWLVPNRSQTGPLKLGSSLGGSRGSWHTRRPRNRLSAPPAVWAPPAGHAAPTRRQATSRPVMAGSSALSSARAAILQALLTAPARPTR